MRTAGWKGEKKEVEKGSKRRKGGGGKRERGKGRRNEGKRRGWRVLGGEGGDGDVKREEKNLGRGRRR